MDVIEEKTKHQSMYLGATYYFCSNSCQKHFDNFPERYVGDKV
jgi:YHS domain-containing protein